MATDGAAPSTTTKKIACSLSWKSRMASGNQAIDGIVCSAVIIEPSAARSTRTRATPRPSTSPTATAAAKPSTARRAVVASPSQSAGLTR